MSLAMLRAEGHQIPDAMVATAVRMNLDWVAILALVRQYGPSVVTVLSQLLSGTPAGALIAQYGPTAIAVIEAVLGGLVPQQPAVG